MFYLWPHWIPIIEIRGATPGHIRFLPRYLLLMKFSRFYSEPDAFRWRCFQTNKPLAKSEQLVLVAVTWRYWTRVKYLSWTFDLIFVSKPFRCKSFSDTIFIRYKSNSNSCLRSKLISNSFSMSTNSFLLANDPYLELWTVYTCKCTSKMKSWRKSRLIKSFSI